MNPARSIEYLTGFLMGLFFSATIEGALIFLYNLLARWFGWQSLILPWWAWIPLPLVCGLFMAKAIADLHLEDY